MPRRTLGGASTRRQLPTRALLPLIPGGEYEDDDDRDDQANNDHPEDCPVHP